MTPTATCDRAGPARLRVPFVLLPAGATGLPVGFRCWAGMIPAVLLALLLTGCARSYRVQVTAPGGAPADRYEVDVVDVFDPQLLAALKALRNDQWFRGQRARYLGLDAKGKLLRVHSSIQRAGTPFKVGAGRGSRGVLVFSRGDRRVQDDTAPAWFQPRKRFLGRFGGGGEFTVLKEP